VRHDGNPDDPEQSLKKGYKNMPVLDNYNTGINN
jgi:hypothetical protein